MYIFSLDSILEHVKIQLSGEKTSALSFVGMSCGGSKVWSFWRVVESSTSTTLVFQQVIAINLLHGDHVASWIPEERVAAAMFVSHDNGTPHTTLVRGWACDSYSFLTIDSFGATRSAEW